MFIAHSELLREVETREDPGSGNSIARVLGAVGSVVRCALAAKSSPIGILDRPGWLARICPLLST